MVKPRKASAALAAREKARARAEGITRRNEELIELASGYFVATDRLEAIETELEAKIAQLREQADREAASVRQDIAAAIRSMLATGEPKRAITERLGISAAEVSAAQRSLAERESHGEAKPSTNEEPTGE